MRGGMRFVQKALSAVVIVVVLLGVVGYTIYAANGILDVLETHQARAEHDTPIAHTATALAVRLLALETGALAEEIAALPTETAPPTKPLAATPSPTETSEPTAVAQALPSETPSATATPTDTSTDTPTATVTPTEAPTDTPTMPPTHTPIPTNTPRPSITPIPTNTPRPTWTPIPTNTPRPTLTPTPSATPTLPPTATPTPTVAPPTATYVIEGTYAIPIETPVVPIPPAMPLLDTDPDVVNFALLGSDTSGGGVGHTDVIILVSVNKRAGSVAMWHLPRDLFVYIPNHTMERINLAYAIGESTGYPGGGFGLLRETIRYNFGVEIDHYARVDFDGFMRIIEELDGLEISVDCAITDWRLKSPELDPLVEDNWERYTLPIGRQHLSPYMALWYARSRKTTNDLDRGRRQMDVLRAMWYQAREQGLLAQVTQLWPEMTQVVETDMQLTDVLAFVPLAVSLDPSGIARYSGVLGEHYQAFVTPDDGRQVSLPNREALIPLIQDFLTPPTANRLGRQAVTVEVVDASGYGRGFDLVAVDRLAWEGFAAFPSNVPTSDVRDLSVIYDYTGQSKSAVLADLQRVLRVGDEQVIVQPNPNRAVDFRVEIGRAYNSCVYGGAEDEIEAGPPIPTVTPVEGVGNVG